MLRLSAICLGARAHGYQNRVMVYAHRRQKSRYLAPKNPHVRSPLANKTPEEYGNNWDPRTGVEWYYRMRHRNHYRHWPWAKWNDDPVRQHQDNTHRRTFHVATGAANQGQPEWNYYKEVGQEYRTPSHFPLPYVAPFIHQYTSKVWSLPTITDHLTAIAERTGLRSIEEAARGGEKLQKLAASADDIPRGLLHHLQLVVEDVVLQNGRKTYRQTQHEKGVLRTREMVRYYALPYLKGAAMPETLAQPSGAYPWGRYTYMDGSVRIHPLQRPDARFKGNLYPA